MKAKDNNISTKIIIRPALGTAVILLIPLVAMQFTNEVKWQASDFLIIGILLFSTGLTYELIARKLPERRHRIIIGIMLGAALLYIWAELAVGIFTNLGS